MAEFAPFENNLKKRQRRQSIRFGLPALIVFVLVLTMLGAVYYAQEEEREEGQAKLIADTLWARQNIQFQTEGISKALGSLSQDPQIYYSEKFKQASLRLVASSGELVAVFRGNELAPVAGLSLDDNLAGPVRVVELMKETIHSRISAGIDGFVGPVQFQGRTFAATVHSALEGRTAVVGLLDLTLMLDKELPWWFTQDNEVELLSSNGELLTRLVKGAPGADVYVHSTTLELGGMPLQLRVNSSNSGPRLFSYGITATLVVLFLLLLASFLLLWRDGRKRLKVEAKLEEEKAFRQSMQDSIAVGMRVWDLKGTIRYVNPAFCRMVGYTADELVGAEFPLPYWPPDNPQEYHRLVAKVIAGNSPREGFETIYRHKEGHLLNVLIVEAPLRNNEGVHVGWMSSVLDITDRKRSEALIADQREKLQAASRFALVGEVASNIAHELNQPLATMVSFAQAGINLSRKGTSPERYTQLLEKIRDQAQRASRVVGSVQNLVRKRQADREKVTALELIDSSRPILGRIAWTHDVDLHFHVEQGEVVLHLDRIMVEQALINLVKNAAEAFLESQKQRDVWVSASIQESGFTLSVTDNGPGFRIEEPEKMFETLVSTKPDGLGLGLSLCRTVAEAHGGRLEAHPVPTGGMRLVISLPLAVYQPIKEDLESV